MCNIEIENFKLEHKIIGDLCGQFVVPAYQRGYRWTQDDVSRLLNDLWESVGTSYSLQPIVIKLRQWDENEDKRKWELIDGQQRLTTIYLLLQYMFRAKIWMDGAPYNLNYETRPKSAQYLENPDPKDQESNIDFFHISQSNEVIGDWFKKHGDKKQTYIASKLRNHLFENVRIIWYEVPQNASSPAIFTRLNIGRIPLTDAELIKAVLLSRVGNRANEIAAQWDSIERDLHHQEIWAFVSGLSADSNDEQYPTRISLLLDTLANLNSPESKPARYYTFDRLRDEIEKDPLIFWNRVVALHAQILGWFEKPHIHNKIGFLIVTATNSAKQFQEIKTGAENKTKSDFDEFLTNCIRKLINVSADNLTDLSYEDGNVGYLKLFHLLLLMNVETASKAGQRFPFYRHVGQMWSLEHIHAQNTQSLTKASQWKTWLKEHAVALNSVELDNRKSEKSDKVLALKKDIDVALNKLQSSTPDFSGSNFDALSQRVLEILSLDDIADHTIRNMALLSRSQNSELSNAVFEVKRQRILKQDQSGEYVPACTRNVFLKYYADADAQQPYFWSEQDKDSYLKAIQYLLSNYFQ